MNQKSKLSYVAFFIVLIIVCIASYFIGNFAPVLSTNNGSFPDYEGFEAVNWGGQITGIVSSITITDASKGIGSVTIENNNNFATFPIDLSAYLTQGDTGVERSGEWVDISNVEVGSSVILELAQVLDTESSNYNNISVSYILLFPN